jgi:hypothetical protein
MGRRMGFSLRQMPFERNREGQLFDGQRGHGRDEFPGLSQLPGQWLFVRGRRARILSICRPCRLIVSCSSS